MTVKSHKNSDVVGINVDIVFASVFTSSVCGCVHGTEALASQTSCTTIFPSSFVMLSFFSVYLHYINVPAGGGVGGKGYHDLGFTH